MRASGVLTIMASMLVAANAAASGRVFEGPYAGNCGDKVQCTLQFGESAGGFDMVLEVADGIDATKVVCAFRGRLAAVAFDVLAGDVDGASVRVMRARSGEVLVSGVPEGACTGARLNGSYVEFFDE